MTLGAPVGAFTSNTGGLSISRASIVVIGAMDGGLIGNTSRFSNVGVGGWIFSVCCARTVPDTLKTDTRKNRMMAVLAGFRHDDASSMRNGQVRSGAFQRVRMKGAGRRHLMFLCGFLLCGFLMTHAFLQALAQCASFYALDCPQFKLPICS